MTVGQGDILYGIMDFKWHLTAGQGGIKWFNWKQDLWKLMEILCKIQGKEFVKKILQIYEIVDSDFKDVQRSS